MGSHRNYESPWCLDKTSLVVWLRLAILGPLITKITWWIYRLFDPNKLYYFTIEITRENILEVEALNTLFKVFIDNHIRSLHLKKKKKSILTIDINRVKQN